MPKPLDKWRINVLCIYSRRVIKTVFKTRWIFALFHEQVTLFTVIVIIIIVVVVVIAIVVVVVIIIINDQFSPAQLLRLS